MLSNSNCRLRIINGHRTNENVLVSEQKVVFDRSWKLKLLNAHFDIWLTICRRIKYGIMKKIEEDAIFSR